MKIGFFLLVVSAFAQERPPSRFRSDTRLVEVYASVFDNRGKPVDGLPRDRFEVLDDGTPQKILNFEAASDNLSCAILLDTTGSMQTALSSVKNAVSLLLDQMREGDSVGIFSFSTSLNILQDFTTDRVAARNAVHRTKASGQTALFDAVAEVSKRISARSGKKVVILFTDGSDNASSLRADSAATRAMKAGVPLFAIAEGDATSNGTLKGQLRRIAEMTGGLVYEARSAKDIAKVFADIQNQLQHVYLFSYTPPEGDAVKWRNIEVRIRGAEHYKIRAKRGYFPE